MAVTFAKISFLTATSANSPIVIPGAEGWKSIAILNDSGSSDIVTLTGGTDTIGGQAPGNITLAAGKGFSYGMGDDDISGLTITIPAATTVYIATCKTYSRNPIGMLLQFL